MAPDEQSGLRAAFAPSALRAALVPRRPAFANPWDSPNDMFSCYLAVSVVSPLLLWGGGALTSELFGFGSHWQRGVYIAAAVVGAAGFMTIVGRERTNLAVDVLTITAWLLLGLLVAPIVGLAPGTGTAIACYAVLLALMFVYVRGFGRWETAFVRTVSWPVTWSLVAACFAFAAYQLILYP